MIVLNWVTEHFADFEGNKEMTDFLDWFEARLLEDVSTIHSFSGFQCALYLDLHCTGDNGIQNTLIHFCRAKLGRSEDWTRQDLCMQD